MEGLFAIHMHGRQDGEIFFLITFWKCFHIHFAPVTKCIYLTVSTMLYHVVWLQHTGLFLCSKKSDLVANAVCHQMSLTPIQYNIQQFLPVTQPILIPLQPVWLKGMQKIRKPPWEHRRLVFQMHGDVSKSKKTYCSDLLTVETQTRSAFQLLPFSLEMNPRPSQTGKTLALSESPSPCSCINSHRNMSELFYLSVAGPIPCCSTSQQWKSTTHCMLSSVIGA